MLVCRTYIYLFASLVFVCLSEFTAPYTRVALPEWTKCNWVRLSGCRSGVISGHAGGDQRVMSAQGAPLFSDLSLLVTVFYLKLYAMHLHNTVFERGRSKLTRHLDEQKRGNIFCNLQNVIILIREMWRGGGGIPETYIRLLILNK